MKCCSDGKGGKNRRTGEKTGGISEKAVGEKGMGFGGRLV